ncbi:MAG: orotidine-5'-phosphate decarboxylase [Gammaproteobacteria bacterium]|jgi:orotidine-5'-phosphate decarboxylase
MSSKIIVALDYPDAQAALDFVERVSPSQCRLKVGLELFTAAGPAFVAGLVERGFDVFLDLKFHDIPNTVAGACRAAAGLGVWMMNVHAGGGRHMMQAAREALESAPVRPLLIAVTVLTSQDAGDLQAVGIDRPVPEQVLHLAGMTAESGLDGVVCSAMEAGNLRTTFGDDFTLVTPGIRPAGGRQDDQKRVVTPVDAVNAGSDYLVIGRPVTQAADPTAVLDELNRQLAEVDAP